MPPVSRFTSPVEVVPAVKEVKKAPVKIEKPKKYREPVKLGPFLRKNAFRLLFFLLLLMWFGEILYYSLKWKPPRERFEEEFSQERRESGQQKLAELSDDLKAEKFQPRSINIEGKRDPFSGGTLTMELVKRPRFTEISLAYKPEVIVISKKPVPITKEPEKPVRETPVRITPILKPQKPEPTIPTVTETTPPKVTPPAPVTRPEISPLIVPQIECPLVYRGSLIMEGIEYIFLEGKQRTYRVTVGDVVEGFRILKKEKGVLYLSREGVIVEIPAE